jgi:hypothetical protein
VKKRAELLHRTYSLSATLIATDARVFALGAT